MTAGDADKCHPEAETFLVDEARSGNRSALNRLLKSCYPRMLKLARRILRNEADAEDAVQEAAMKVMLNLGQLESAAAFSAWVNMIVRRCCLRILDRRTADQKAGVGFPSEGSDLPDPLESGHRAEDRIHIEEVFRFLGEGKAEILKLRLQLGLSVRETAATLGISENAIKVRLHRARQQALIFV